MKRRVLCGVVAALGFGLAGCGGGPIEEGTPKDLTPGVSLSDPSVAPKMVPLGKMDKGKITKGETTPAPEPGK
jgi:hypothetical protein